MISRRTAGLDDWSPTLLRYSQYRVDQVLPVAVAIMRNQAEISPKLKAVSKKYSQEKYGNVSEVKLATMDTQQDLGIGLWQL